MIGAGVAQHYIMYSCVSCCDCGNTSDSQWEAEFPSSLYLMRMEQNILIAIQTTQHCTSSCRKTKHPLIQVIVLSLSMTIISGE